MNDIVLIGSRALAIRKPECLQRKPLDFDFICASRSAAENWIDQNKSLIDNQKQYEIEDGKKLIIEGAIPLEFSFAQEGSSDQMFLEMVKNDPETIDTKEFGIVPNLDLLFLLKQSHRYKKNSPHWSKVLVDWTLMKRFGAKIRPEYQELLKLREKETYNYKHPKLKGVSKDDFFSPSVKYTWDHDTIHVAVAREKRDGVGYPAYRHFQKDGSEVECDMSKFWPLDHQIKLNSVYEEATVLCVERALTDYRDKWPDIKKAWVFALSKILSSISSGKWRDWGYEHAFEVMAMYDPEFLNKFDQAVKDGIVKPYEKILV